MFFRFLINENTHDLCAMSNRFTEEQQKDYAQMLFTRFDETIKGIVQKTGASEAVVRRWIKDCNWEGMRRSLLTARETQLELLYDILNNITNRVKQDEEGGNTKDADLIIKYTAAIKNLEADTSISQIIEVAKLFTIWLQHTDTELCKTVTLYFDTFIKERLKKAA